MKTLLAAVSLVILAPAAAYAAPTPTPKATTTPAPVMTPAPAPMATPEAAAEPAPEVAAKTVEPFTAGEGDPNAKTFGVGFGWTFPAALTSPNTVSARFRMKSGLTVEPVLNASFTQGFTHSHFAVDGGGSTAERNYTAIIGAAAQLRKPMGRRGPVQMTMLLTPGVIWTDSVDNGPGIEDRVYDSTTAFGLGWGLGVEYYPSAKIIDQHWSFSLDAQNPLLGFAYNTNYDQASRERTNTTNYIVSGTWAPVVRGMVHLYY